MRQKTKRRKKQKRKYSHKRGKVHSHRHVSRVVGRNSRRKQRGGGVRHRRFGSRRCKSCTAFGSGRFHLCWNTTAGGGESGNKKRNLLHKREIERKSGGNIDEHENL